MIGAWDVQVALVGLLKAGGIAAGRVYDNAPGDVVFPYVEVGDTQALGADVTGRSGSDETLSIDIWDRANASGGHRGQKNVKQIGDAIHGLLNGKAIDVENRSAAFAIVRDLRTVADPDALTTHGVLSVRIQHFGPKET